MSCADYDPRNPRSRCTHFEGSREDIKFNTGVVSPNIVITNHRDETTVDSVMPCWKTERFYLICIEPREGCLTFVGRWHSLGGMLYFGQHKSTETLVSFTLTCTAIR